MRESIWTDEKLLESLQLVAPGTVLREGLENILRAKTGAIIVIGDSHEVLSIVDGGFEINTDFSPQNIYELAKMDGAIILSKDAKKILYANAQLMPDPTISTTETGTRHRTAERVAKQTGETIVSISQRRHIITLYSGSVKYVLKDESKVITKGNQAIQTLEKYRAVMDFTLNKLTVLEFDNIVTLYDVCMAIKRIEMVTQIVDEIRFYITELGTEGRLISMQLEELASDVEEYKNLVVRDYIIADKISIIGEIIKEIKKCSVDGNADMNVISRLLGYTVGLDFQISSRGYRILNSIPRLPMLIIENVVVHFNNLLNISNASIEELDMVEGIGEVRARTIKENLRRIKDQVFSERHI